MAKVSKLVKGVAVAFLALAHCLGMAAPAAPADYYECPPSDASGGKVVFSNSLSEVEAKARNCTLHRKRLAAAS